MTKAELLSMELAEYNVLVRMDPVAAKSAGGIMLPDSAIDRDSISRQLGTLESAGAFAFNYAEWPQNSGPPQPGDRVMIAQFDGKAYEVEGEQFRVVKDKSVVGFWRARQALAEAA